MHHTLDVVVEVFIVRYRNPLFKIFYVADAFEIVFFAECSVLCGTNKFNKGIMLNLQGVLHDLLNGRQALF